MQLNFKSYGQGQPLIILHGLFGTLDNWQTHAKQLAEHFLVYLFDARDHGRSPHTDHIDYPTMAEDLLEFMEQNWIYKAHILGHSMGGKTAMEFALTYPEMVDKLIAVDIAPKTYPPGHNEIFEALFSIDLNTLKTRQEAEAILEKNVPAYSTRQFLLKSLSRSQDGGFEWKMNLPVIFRDYPKILEAPTATGVFSGPTLFIRGGQSDYVLDSDWPTVLQYFPAARLETIPNSGHWVHAEAPEVLLQLVQAFLMQ
jgi:pimeloyl-ACP methyl ester carboxylesterase